MRVHTQTQTHRHTDTHTCVCRLRHRHRHTHAHARTHSDTDTHNNTHFWISLSCWDFMNKGRPVVFLSSALLCSASASDVHLHRADSDSGPEPATRQQIKAHCWGKHNARTAADALISCSLFTPDIAVVQCGQRANHQPLSQMAWCCPLFLRELTINPSPRWPGVVRFFLRDNSTRKMSES